MRQYIRMNAGPGVPEHQPVVGMTDADFDPDFSPSCLGNMAQGVAWCARARGIPCTVIAPDSAPAAKLDAIERLGARVIRVPFERWWQTFQDRRFPGVEGTFIHAFDDLHVMAGNGTIALEILEDLPSTRVLFLSAFADDELVRAAIMIGAHGYLLKELDARSLVRSIKRVAGGESILDPRLRSSLVDWVMRNSSPPDATGRQELAPQEQRIVALVAEGKTNKQIAAVLNISPLTVKNYLHRIFEKVGIQRRSQAAALHIRKEI